jgi:hypothetical protein
MKEIIKMNTPKQNEYLVRWCIEHHETDKLRGLLNDEVQLTPFILTCMVFFGYSDDEIKNIILYVKNPHRDVFVWLCKHFKLSEISDIIDHFKENLPYEVFTEKELIELKLWNILARRHKWDIIAQHSPEFLEEYTDNEEAMKTLLKINFNKYVERAFSQGMYYPIISAKDGWKYLLENNKKESVFRFFKFSLAILSDEEITAACAYFKEKGLIDELYQNQVYEFLLKNRIFEPFIKNHSTNHLFLEKFPEQVKWEDLWNHYHSDKGMREKIISAAKVNENNPACQKFILKHTGLFSFLHN